MKKITINVKDWLTRSWFFYTIVFFLCLVVIDHKTLLARQIIFNKYIFGEIDVSRPQMARQLFDLVNKWDSQDTEFFLSLGDLFAKHHYYGKAFTIYEKALRSDPKNKNAYLAIGSVLANMKMFDRAIMVWRAGQKLYPQEESFEESIQKAQSLKNTPP